MSMIQISKVIQLLENRAREELAEPEDSPRHPADRANALRLAADAFRGLERNDDGTVQLSEVIDDLEEEAKTAEPAQRDLIERIVGQLMLVDTIYANMDT